MTGRESYGDASEGERKEDEPWAKELADTEFSKFKVETGDKSISKEY